MILDSKEAKNKKSQGFRKSYEIYLVKNELNEILIGLIIIIFKTTNFNVYLIISNPKRKKTFTKNFFRYFH